MADEKTEAAPRDLVCEIEKWAKTEDDRWRPMWEVLQSIRDDYTDPSEFSLENAMFVDMVLDDLEDRLHKNGVGVGFCTFNMENTEARKKAFDEQYKCNENGVYSNRARALKLFSEEIAMMNTEEIPVFVSQAVEALYSRFGWGLINKALCVARAKEEFEREAKGAA